MLLHDGWASFALEMSGFWMAKDGKEEMFGTVRDPQSQPLVENLSCLFLDSGSRKFMAEEPR